MENTNPQAAGEGRRTGLAIASLALGVISIPALGLLVVGAVIGLVLGIVALNRIGQNPAKFGGRGLAMAGIVTNVIGLGLSVVAVIIAVIAVPNYTKARIAAQNTIAVQSVRRIVQGELSYSLTHQGYADLKTLGDEGEIGPTLASGLENGYRFEVRLKDGGRSFAVTATPVPYAGPRRKSFYADESGVIHAAEKLGRMATEADPALF